MSKFNRESGRGSSRESFNRGGFSNKRNSSRGGSDRGSTTMHKAVCDECGKDCEVPFRPTGGKPVYCSNCFSGHDNSDKKFNDRGFSGKRFSDSRSSDRKMYKAICDECGADCELPFKPSGDKPVYCSNCFSKGGTRNSSVKKESHQSNNNLDEINSKLDKILKLLSSSSSSNNLNSNETKKSIILESSTNSKLKKTPKILKNTSKELKLKKITKSPKRSKK